MRCELDVDECAKGTDNCSLSQNTVCENKQGSFACVCKKGYAIGMEGDCVVGMCVKDERIRSRGYKTFFMLNSIEHEIVPAY